MLRRHSYMRIAYVDAVMLRVRHRDKERNNS